VSLAATLAAEAPPPGIAPPAQALWWLAKGGLKPGGAGWERAHAICQEREGDPDHDAVHGLAHWIEGDLANADYWYRRAGRRRAGPDVAAEWERLAAALA
jgi:hypothetical protein